MKKILLVVLMALCAASLSFAKDHPLGECLEECQGKADCTEDCTIKNAGDQSVNPN